MDDERGTDDCSRRSDDGYALKYCLGGRVCAQDEDGELCVDPEYCRWMREREGEPWPTAECVYSDGTVFVDGPPDAPCGEGAHPAAGFCGGRCGDTCPSVIASPVLGPSCFGLSEHRAFGVCSLSPNPHCDPSGAAERLRDCSIEVAARSGGTTLEPCACMRLTREPGGTFPEHGDPVSAQSCLAYRAIYPDQVSCRDAEWNEL